MAAADLVQEFLGMLTRGMGAARGRTEWRPAVSRGVLHDERGEERAAGTGTGEGAHDEL